MLLYGNDFADERAQILLAQPALITLLLANHCLMSYECRRHLGSYLQHDTDLLARARRH